LYRKVGTHDISPLEFVRVCDYKRFPKKYSEKIKAAMLNHYKYNAIAFDKLTEEEKNVIFHCYNSLDGTNNEEVAKIKFIFLTDVVNKASDLPGYKYSFYNGGETYLRLREGWRKHQLDNQFLRDFLTLELTEGLKNDFSEIVRMAEKNGLFKEDDEKRRKEMEEYLTYLGTLKTLSFPKKLF
jgi:hypothetical protein